MNNRGSKSNLSMNFTNHRTITKSPNNFSFMEFNTKHLLPHSKKSSIPFNKSEPAYRNFNQMDCSTRLNTSLPSGNFLSKSLKSISKSKSDIGDLEIIVWNKLKTKRLISFTCKENYLNLDGFEGSPISNFDRQNFVESGSKIISKIGIEICEDRQKNAHYRFSLDSLGMAQMKKSEKKNFKELGWSARNGKYNLNLKIDSRHQRKTVYSPFFKKVCGNQHFKKLKVKNGNMLRFGRIIKIK